MLEFDEMYGVHTGENMVDLLYITLELLQIERKILIITAENASNDDLSISELVFNLQERLRSPEIAVEETEILRV
jgi:hypothetical protein